LINYPLAIRVAERFRRSLINVASVRDLFGSRVCCAPQIFVGSVAERVKAYGDRVITIA